MREAEDMMSSIREVAKEALLSTEESKRKHDWSLKKSNIRDAIHEYVYNQTKRNPMILPILMEVSLSGENSMTLSDEE